MMFVEFVWQLFLVLFGAMVLTIIVTSVVDFLKKDRIRMPKDLADHLREQGYDPDKGEIRVLQPGTAYPVYTKRNGGDANEVKPSPVDVSRKPIQNLNHKEEEKHEMITKGSVLEGLVLVFKGLNLLFTGRDHRAVIARLNFIFTIDPKGPVKVWPKGTTNMQMDDTQTSTASFQFLDVDENPTTPPVDPDTGVVVKPTWETDSPNAIKLTPSADGLSCEIATPSPGPLVTGALITAHFGGTKIPDATGTVDVVASGAMKVVMNFSDPA